MDIPNIQNIQTIPNAQTNMISIPKLDFLSVAKSILLFIIVIFVAKFISERITEYGKKGPDDDIENVEHKKISNVNLLYKQFSMIAFYGIIFLGLVVIVPMYYGIEPKILFSVLGPFIIALGFSLPTQISNIWCSMIMMVHNVYKVNDLVSISIGNNTIKGRIVEINLFYTKLAQLDTGSEITITNNVLMGGISVNNSNIYDISSSGLKNLKKDVQK
jgi:small-conductance mechanosensitive channel